MTGTSPMERDGIMSSNNNVPNYQAVTYSNEQISPLISVSDAVKADYSNENNEDGPVFRDVPFAILFIIHLIVMLWLGIFVAPDGYINVDFNWTSIENEILTENDDVTEEDMEKVEEFIQEASDYIQIYPYRIVVYIVIPCLLIAFLIAFFVTSSIIRPFPKPLVYFSLVASVFVTAILMILSSISSQSIPIYIISGFAIVGVVYYVRIAWKMVPFASVNLKVALEGIGTNWGMYLVAFVFAELGFIWNLYWLYVVIGTSMKMTTDCLQENPDSTIDDDACDPEFFAMLGFLLSLYWTSTVIMNMIQVTVAGVMATWCFVSEEAETCCSPAVSTSLCRSMTFSFGSICLGSLLQALVAVFRFMLEQARSQRDNRDQNACGTFCLCILECLAKCLEDILEYFNQWAFVFVGIYGTSYIESGRKVIELFRARGWTSIITDNLVGYALGFTTVVIGIITGFIGIWIEKIVSSNKSISADIKSYIFGPIDNPQIFAFVLSFLIGLWVASVMFNVVKGAVNALIVCWADSPAKLEYQHPTLTREMAESWISVFPEASAHIRINSTQSGDA